MATTAAMPTPMNPSFSNQRTTESTRVVNSTNPMTMIADRRLFCATWSYTKAG